MGNNKYTKIVNDLNQVINNIEKLKQTKENLAWDSMILLANAISKLNDELFDHTYDHK